MLISVDFEPIGKRIEVASNTTLLRAAQQAGLALSSACGGVGRCGQCRLEILAGSVSPPTVDEEYILTELELHTDNAWHVIHTFRATSKYMSPHLRS